MWAMDEVVEGPKVEYGAETPIPLGDREIPGIKTTTPLRFWNHFYSVLLQESCYFVSQDR